MGRRDATLESPQDRGPSIRCEIDPRPLAELGQESVDPITRILQVRRAGEQALEQRSDGLDPGDRVDGLWQEGLRHSRERGRLRVLDDHGAARRGDVLGAGGPVGPRATQDHGDEVLPEDLRGCLQQPVDRRLRTVRLLGLEMDRVVRDRDVAIGRHDVDRTVLEPGLVLDPDHVELGPALDDLDEARAVLGMQVLGHHDRGREGRRQARDHHRQRFDPARGGPDDHEPIDSIRGSPPARRHASSVRRRGRAASCKTPRLDASCKATGSALGRSHGHDI